MAGLLIFIICCVISTVLATLFMWAGDIAFTNKQFNEACEWALERERIKNLIDNSEIYETIAKIDKMEIKVEPAEITQPVSEPTAADNLIKEAQEWKV